MDAALIIAGWKRRLVVMADKPPYVYRNTPRHSTEEHYRRLTTFVGFSEPQVAAAEARLGVRFPMVFRRYLLEMAESPGALFCGSRLAGVESFELFRTDVLELMSEAEPTLASPPEAVVFLSLQGYAFVFLLAAGGFDSPPMQWTEGTREPRQVAPSFAGMVDAELGTDGGQCQTVTPEWRLLPHAPSRRRPFGVTPGPCQRRYALWISLHQINREGRPGRVAIPAPAPASCLRCPSGRNYPHAPSGPLSSPVERTPDME